MTKRFFFILMFAIAISAKTEAYNLYFGGTHSHTSFSDGQGLAGEAWDVARNQAQTDFWFITDHYQQIDVSTTILSGETNVNEWKYQKEVAKAKTENGKFLALNGWEWGDGIRGHMNVLFDQAQPPDFLMTGTYERFVSVWIKKHPRSLTGMNHPFWSADHNMDNLYNFKYIPELASQTVYIEVSQVEDIPFYYIALDRGWRVAPLGAQDNHRPNWGLSSEFAAVYADALTEDSIREAFIARRFYATIDKTLKLDFTGNGKPMGSQLAGDTIKLEVTVSHEKEVPAFVRIISNGGGIVKEWKPEKNEFKAEFRPPVNLEKDRWYVAYVSMPDGRYSISAPIWVKNL